MRKNFITKIYIPQHLHFECLTYNNGYIFWISGNNSTTYHYYEHKNAITTEFTLKKKQSSLTIKRSELTKTKNFYYLWPSKEQKKQKINFKQMQNQILKTIWSTHTGFTKNLTLRGVGYKFFKRNKYLFLSLGYSHNVNIIIPSNVYTKFNRKSTKMKFNAANFQILTDLLANIRKFRKPDVYKGKGVRYRYERIKLKEGKKTKV